MILKMEKYFGFKFCNLRIHEERCKKKSDGIYLQVYATIVHFQIHAQLFHQLTSILAYESQKNQTLRKIALF